MTIEIKIVADNDTELEWKMGMVGFFRCSTTAPVTTSEAAGDAPAQTTASEAATETPVAIVDTRPVGQPSEGNKRRNSTEKAADDALEALASQKGIALDALNGAIAQAGRAEAERQLRERPDAEAATAAISTGENRVGPEDDPETEAQDAADEAAETAANGGLAPIDELRRVVGDYQKKFGMPAAVALCQEGGLIGCGMTEVPEADLPAVIARVREAIEKGEAPAPAETGSVFDAEPEKPATIDDLKKAMLRYAKRFDGQDTDMSKMPHTMADCPAIFSRLFGSGVAKLSQVPADGYGKAIAAIDEAIAKNPFGR